MDGWGFPGPQGDPRALSFPHNSLVCPELIFRVGSDRLVGAGQ